MFSALLLTKARSELLIVPIVICVFRILPPSFHAPPAVPVLATGASATNTDQLAPSLVILTSSLGSSTEYVAPPSIVCDPAGVTVRAGVGRVVLAFLIQ